MTEYSSTDDADSGEDACPNKLQLLLAEVAEMPSVTCLLRFMNSDIVEDAHGELLDLGAESEWTEFATNEPGLLAAANVPPSLEHVKKHGFLHLLQSRADLYHEDFLRAFDDLVSTLLAETIAVKLIRLESKLANARRDHRLEDIANLSKQAEKYRQLAEQFAPPAHLMWYLEVLNRR